MSILGISAGFHDAAATVIDKQGEILFAGHSERYSKIKNDADIHQDLLRDSWQYANGNIDTIAYYEIPWKKQLRQAYSGQGIEWDKLTTSQILNKQFGPCVLPDKIVSYNHHLSHAAAGFQTSPYDRATVVVIDAIGEFDTVSIYGAEYINGMAKYRRLWVKKYPHSIGLFYTAITQRLGLKPMEDEYITMGMSAYGKPAHASAMESLIIRDINNLQFKENLHIGLPSNYLDSVTHADIAASAQLLAEKLIYKVMEKARDFCWSTNLVYSGGVALNCLANRKLGDYFDSIWIMPNPGDAGSSLGAACLASGRRVHWRGPYLGHNIEGDYPVSEACRILLDTGIVGVASGRAEFGPRALGNRSLLADPRVPNIKDKVNEIKHRQKFRPFAPAILAEHADVFFDMPRGFTDSPYMQSVAICRNPDAYPGIVHVDGTSRVQTVPNNNTGIRRLLEEWYRLTGCPMLLNTSLNIRGEPMVNDRADADRFETRYGVKVVS